MACSEENFMMARVTFSGAGDDGGEMRGVRRATWVYEGIQKMFNMAWSLPLPLPLPRPLLIVGLCQPDL